jgi:hypothetical protein
VVDVQFGDAVGGVRSAELATEPVSLHHAKPDSERKSWAPLRRPDRFAGKPPPHGLDLLHSFFASVRMSLDVLHEFIEGIEVIGHAAVTLHVTNEIPVRAIEPPLLYEPSPETARRRARIHRPYRGHVRDLAHYFQ